MLSMAKGKAATASAPGADKSRTQRWGVGTMAIATINGMLRRILTALRVHRHSPFTMAEYLRSLGAQIGRDCFIVPSNLGTEPYLVKIGNHVAIADGVLFLNHDGGAWVFRGWIPDLQSFGPIVIDDNCFIGQRAILGPGIHIGANSVVGAGSLVISDVPPNTLVVGVPARPFGSLAKYREKCLLRWAEQRPPDTELSDSETWWAARHYAENRERLRRRLVALFSYRMT